MALTLWPAAGRVFKLCQCWCRRCTSSISTRGTSWRGCNDERWINNDFTSKQKKIRVKIVGGYNNNTTVITVQWGLNSLYCTAECSLWYGKNFLHVIPLFKRNLSVRKAVAAVVSKIEKNGGHIPKTLHTLPVCCGTVTHSLHSLGDKTLQLDKYGNTVEMRGYN